jgi:hypothetical protein
MRTGILSPKQVLERFRIAPNVYLLGSFEMALTIYNQQARALNLAWSMVESKSPETLQSVAIVGGGFAGLTAAAGLLHKGVKHVTVFERRSVLCPLQQGSDARWVHPRIYEWPDLGSDLPTAALPLLNWSAGRASDVVVEVLTFWERLVDSLEPDRIDVYLNVKHLRLNQDLEIEWVGEKSGLDQKATTSGTKKRFNSVVLAVGFGVERDALFSYWRNETLGQPELDIGKRTYLVSGHGDGALIDMFRIRISRFRQDRILVDLFGQNSRLMMALRKAKNELDRRLLKPEKLYDRFESIAANPAVRFNRLIKSLRKRLRGDTAAILQMNRKVDSFRKVFESPASFQNHFLLFALYRAGGFVPTSKADCSRICKEYGINATDIVCRHGTDRIEAVEDVMDGALFRQSKRRINILRARKNQPSTICWLGGYWHDHSKRLKGKALTVDTNKSSWRLEHLPSATEVFVSGFVATIAGYLDGTGSCGNDFRVTLHRTLYIGSERTLQQAAHYAGRTTRLGDPGRTFAFGNATVGYAAVKKKIIRTRPMRSGETDAGYASKLQSDMNVLNLEVHSQPMAGNVKSILAVPILSDDGKYVVAVLFADSINPNVFHINCIKQLVCMCEHFASSIGKVQADRVHNFPMSVEPRPGGGTVPPSNKLRVLQIVESPAAPFGAATNYLNIEFTDFIAAERGPNYA